LLVWGQKSAESTVQLSQPSWGAVAVVNGDERDVGGVKQSLSAEMGPIGFINTFGAKRVE